MELIAYYRVSTDRQGQSGLGLEAQRERVRVFASDRKHVVIDEIIEVQSGKDDSRPELARALSTARARRAGIIVAKLDRLARSARFLDTIVTSGVEVLFCDLPELPPGPTGKFMVQIMGSIAELEAGMISERTRNALKAAKQRGKILGGFRGTAVTPKARVASAEARGRRADQTALRVMESIGKTPGRSLREIAAHLTQQKIETPSGGTEWSAMQVQRIIDRARALNQRDVDAALERARQLAEL